MLYLHVLQKIKSFPLIFFIILLPFLLFYWTLPFLWTKTIGADYLRYSMSYQMELLFSLKSGSVPLYVPGFAGGHSSSALTLGQFFHPLSHIASIMPGYWDGKAMEWNTFLKLISLALSHLILFLFLQKIRLGTIFSFTLSFFTVYNLRLMDLFRVGAPLEAYTAGFILCAVIGWYYLNQTKWLGPLSIIGLTYLLICSGHPEEMYYGMLSTGIFVLVAPFYLSSMLPEKQVSFGIALQFWLRVGSCMMLGILLSSAYILPFYFDFIVVNAERVTQTYAMANSTMNYLFETLNNFFFPLRSQAMSAFGGSLLILVPALLPVLRVFGIKIPRSVWIIWGVCLLVFLHMQGSRTPVHRLTWQYLPLAGSIRNAGRIAMMMPFFMMLIFAWIIKAEPPEDRVGNFFSSLRPVTILAILASFLLLLYYLMHVAGYYLFRLDSVVSLFSNFFPGNPRNRFFVELTVFILGMGALFVLANMGMGSNSKNRLLGALLIAITIVQVGIVIKYRSGTWIERKVDAPTFSEMQMQKRESINYRYYQGYGMASSSVKKQLEESFLEPFLGRIFTEVIPVKNLDEAYNKMHQDRISQQAFIEGYNPADAKRLTEGGKNMTEGSVKLTYSSFNKLQFNVYSEAPAIFGLSYPYMKSWSAWLNGKRVKIYRANGSAHAIEIPEGDSLIEFRYWSDAFFWGMIISCLTFVLVGCFVSFRALKGLSMAAGVISVCVIAAGGFGIWYNGLYSGDNLKTNYTWSYTLPLKRSNLAYGKKAWMDANSITSNWASRELALYSTRLVDGDRSKCSGYISRLTDDPTLFLDLNQIRSIKTIALFERCENQSLIEGPLTFIRHMTKRSPNQLVNARPLQIAISSDGSTWSTVTSVVSRIEADDPTSIVFEEPITARYIRIKASGKSQLSFDEVEVYGSQILE